MNPVKKIRWKYILLIAALVFILACLRLFVVAFYKVPSASMEDTLTMGDRVLVARFIYGMQLPFTDRYILRFHKPAVGDVVVFRPPPRAGRTQLFIKRIVGVSGDTIEIRNGDLYRNGVAVMDEDYIKRSPSSRMSTQSLRPFKIPPGHVFVMGDNRDHSSDSRAWGPIPVENIKGQVSFIYSSQDTKRIGRRIK
jgi:signal peptidase I